MKAVVAWLAIAILAGATAVLLLSRHRTLAARRAELESGPVAARGHAAALAERQAKVQARPSETELNLLRQEVQEAVALRAEVKHLREQVAEADRLAALRRKFAAGAIVPAREWSRSGHRSAEAALDTLLWAAAGGDVGALAASVHVEPDASAAAKELFATLPASTQAEYGTPERMLAYFTIRDVPAGELRVRQWHDSGDAARKVSLIVQDHSGNAKSCTLVFQQDGAEWKAILPAEAVARYAQMLR